MGIVFITDKPYKKLEDIKIVSVKEGLELLYYFTEKETEIGYDLETTGLDPYKNVPLLEIIGNEETQFIIDCSYANSAEVLKHTNLSFIGANLKFDIQFMYNHFKFIPKRVFDVMLAEQRLLQSDGLSASLEAIVRRRLKVQLDKSVRIDFETFDPIRDRYTPLQLRYAADDVKYLTSIKKAQTEVAKINNQLSLIELENRLSIIVAFMELDGFVFDSDKWIATINKYKSIRKSKKLELDDEIKFLKEHICPDYNKVYMIGGKWESKRKGDSIVQTDLFQEAKEVSLDSVKLSTRFNYGSSDQIVQLFGILEQALPSKQDEYIIPILNEKGKVINRTELTTQENSLHLLCTERPNSPMVPFINGLLEYRNANTKINNFGENFLSKINPITGKIHTVYRQAHAVTSRFQSGGGDKQPDRFNAQNIPADSNDHRSCFLPDDGCSFGICDWTGAEAIIMGDKAADHIFLHNREDLHSFLATKSWRAVYNYRFKQAVINKSSEEVQKELLHKASTFTVSQSENKPIRTQFKGATFGVPYGVFPKKLAKTLDISQEEAKIVIGVFDSTIPKVMANRKDNVNWVLGYFADKWKGGTPHGYLPLNNRTNSRIWFPKIIEAIKFQIEPDWHDIKEAQNASRNYDIQGTQADMIKEAMVELYYKYIVPNKLTSSCKLRLQVHDELVIQQPFYMDGVSNEWFSSKQKFVTFVLDKPQELNDETIIYYKLVNNTHVVDYKVVNKKLVSVDCSVPQLTSYVMNEVANRYLSHVRMSSDLKVKNSWEK